MAPLAGFGEGAQAQDPAAAAAGGAMREAGAVHYLTKSAAGDTLLAAIRACVLP